jgi:hypothetical protein
MEEIMELRCILQQGSIAKHIITSALILAAVEVAICIKCLMSWTYNK